jgi:hypothetical protein
MCSRELVELLVEHRQENLPHSYQWRAIGMALSYIHLL